MGVNLNPDKRCNFDCVYCEVDRKIAGKSGPVDLAQAADELNWLLRHALRGGLASEAKFAEVPDLTRQIRDIAFSGDGEPTLVPNFDACVEMVVQVRRELELNETKLVLITDAAGLDKAAVRRGLERMDAHQGEVWGKLDAGTEEYFQLVNRSLIRLSRILRNLTLTAQARSIVVQSLFLKIRGDSMPGEELTAYCDRLNEIQSAGGRIREVHAYTVARPTPEVWATRLNREELEEKADVIRQKTGLEVMTFD